MACHRCVVTGIRTCDPEEAEIKCELCGWCKTHEVKFKYPTEREIKLREELKDGY